MAVQCPACGGTDLHRVGRIPPGYTFAGRVLDEGMGEADLLRCRHCLLGFRHPRPSPQELAALYQLAESAQWTYDAVTRRDWVLAGRLVREAGARSVLDVGCFDGGFLRGLDGVQRKAGIEISAPAAERASAAGIDVLGSTLEETKAEAQFDAVVAFDVIEHVHDPLDFLRGMSRHARPGGLVLVSTGNLDAPAWRFMGAPYWYAALPEHLSFTSPSWIDWAGGELGLKLERTELFSHAADRSRGVRLSEAVKNVIYRLSPGFFAFLRRKGLGGVSVGESGDLARTPPIWITARDQYVAVLRKQ